MSKMRLFASTAANRGSGFFIPGNAGGASRDRTDDLKLAKLALSQLSYGPARMFINVRTRGQVRSKWWAEKELNLRPHAYQACALTT
jgi:hypothetical protein